MTTPTLLIVAAIAIVLAAYGNAMRKVTYRRRDMAARGEETIGTTKFYDGLGLTLFVVGAVVAVASVFWLGFGNPVDFYNDAIRG